MWVAVVVVVAVAAITFGVYLAVSDRPWSRCPHCDTLAVLAATRRCTHCGKATR